MRRSGVRLLSPAPDPKEKARYVSHSGLSCSLRPYSHHVANRAEERQSSPSVSPQPLPWRAYVSGNVVQRLRQRQIDRRLEQGPGAIRIDDGRTLAGKKGGELVLRRNRKIPGVGATDRRQEAMRILGKASVLRIHQVILIEGLPIGQVAGAQDGVDLFSLQFVPVWIRALA